MTNEENALKINENFVQNAISVRGEAGRIWIENLPKVIQEYEVQWSIKVGQPFGLSYNYAAPAVRSDQTDAVLKIGFKGDREFLSEKEALKIFNGQGAVKLLQEDIENAVVLLERVSPGLSLDSLKNDEQETRIAAKVAKELWKPDPQNASLIPLESWYKGFAKMRQKFSGSSGLIPSELFNKGEKLFQHLLDTTQTPKLIHGDFHHGNILSSQSHGWLIIDPKGIIGDPIYDLAVFLYNPTTSLLQQADVKAILEKRIDIFSKHLGFDKNRIRDWGIAQAVLSAIWSIEDQTGGWESTIKVAEILDSL